MKATKQQILTALDAFAGQRSGIEFGNYGDVSAFRKEQRSITRDLHDAKVLLCAVSLRDSITADDLRKAFSAYSGRLTLVDYGEHYECPHKKQAEAGGKNCSCDFCIAQRRGKPLTGVRLRYCTGQYFPTEYRKAVCAVLSSALWDWMCNTSMPPVDGFEVLKWGERTGREFGPDDKKAAERFLEESGGSTWGHVAELHQNRQAGDWLRRAFVREFGRGLAGRWFN